MMKKVYAVFSMVAVALVAFAMEAQAQVFPPSAGQTTALANVSADIVLWGALLIGVALTILAYKRITRIVK